MSFDGRSKSASSLDGDLTFPEPVARRGGKPLKPSQSFRSQRNAESTMASELVSPEARGASPSSMDLVGPCEIVSGPEVREWLAKSRVATLVRVVADNLARHVGANALVMRLETEPDAPEEQRLHLVAQVPGSSTTAIDRLFSFTAASWWLAIVQNTRGVIVVDVEFL